MNQEFLVKGCIEINRELIRLVDKGVFISCSKMSGLCRERKLVSFIDEKQNERKCLNYFFKHEKSLLFDQDNFDYFFEQMEGYTQEYGPETWGLKRESNGLLWGAAVANEILLRLIEPKLFPSHKKQQRLLKEFGAEE
jgi:hypothetical protein